MNLKRVRAGVVGMTAIVYFATCTAVFAADANYGERAGKWATKQLEAVWMAAVAAGACMFLFPGARKPGILAGYIGAVFLTGFAIFNPTGVESMIRGISNVITG